MNVFVTKNEKTPDKLDNKIGMSLWNIAIASAPYETGNLRRSIILSKNTDSLKKYVYDDYRAYYLNYLEEGIGRVKKHTGFIENKTIGSMMYELINYLQSGEVTFSNFPVVELRSGIYRMYERQIARNNNMDTKRRLSANDRALLSKAFVDSQNKDVTGVRSFNTNNLKPDTVNTFSDTLYKSKGKIKQRSG